MSAQLGRGFRDELGLAGPVTPAKLGDGAVDPGPGPAAQGVGAHAPAGMMNIPSGSASSLMIVSRAGTPGSPSRATITLVVRAGAGRPNRPACSAATARERGMPSGAASTNHSAP